MIAVKTRNVQKPLIAGLLLAASAFIPATVAAAAPLAAASGVVEMAPVKDMEGTIQKLDFGANTMIFQGIRYYMAPELTVEIRGGPGAFTMLRTGMKALVTYRVISASERQAVSIVQLPDNTAIDEV